MSSSFIPELIRECPTRWLYTGSLVQLVVCRTQRAEDAPEASNVCVGGHCQPCFQCLGAVCGHAYCKGSCRNSRVGPRGDLNQLENRAAAWRSRRSFPIRQQSFISCNYVLETAQTGFNVLQRNVFIKGQGISSGAGCSAAAQQNPEQNIIDKNWLTGKFLLKNYIRNEVRMCKCPIMAPKTGLSVLISATQISLSGCTHLSSSTVQLANNSRQGITEP